jgi:hypothetical protein
MLIASRSLLLSSSPKEVVKTFLSLFLLRRKSLMIYLTFTQFFRHFSSRGNEIFLPLLVVGAFFSVVTAKFPSENPINFYHFARQIASSVLQFAKISGEKKIRQSTVQPVAAAWSFKTELKLKKRKKSQPRREELKFYF